MTENLALVRFKENRAEQHSRLVAQIQAMITDFELLSSNLDSQIRAEEDLKKNRDPSHFAYPTLAKAAIQRRNDLFQSIDKLKNQLDSAKKALREETEELHAIAAGGLGIVHR